MINEITAALTALKTATDIAEFFKKTDTQFEAAESKLKAAELIMALADAKIALAGSQEQIAELEAEKKQLMEELAGKNTPRLIGETYWIGDEETPDGPFCTMCHDVNGKLVRLKTLDPISTAAMRNRGGKNHSCPSCNQPYRV